MRRVFYTEGAEVFGVFVDLFSFGINNVLFFARLFDLEFREVFNSRFFMRTFYFDIALDLFLLRCLGDHFGLGHRSRRNTDPQ
jgi:hypothetical protein